MTRRERWIAGIIAALVLALGAWFAWQIFSKVPPPPEPPKEREVRVIQPEVTSMEDVPKFVNDKPVPPPDPRIDLPQPDNKSDEHIWGNRSAPYSLVLYTDLNPYAYFFIPALKKMVEDHGTDLNLIFRHFPMDREISSRSLQVSECVWAEKGEVGFWNYLDAAVLVTKKTDDTYVDAGVQAGAEKAKLQDCLKRQLMRNYVFAMGQKGHFRSQVKMTPTVLVVNNESADVRKVDGVNTIAYYEKVLQEIK